LKRAKKFIDRLRLSVKVSHNVDFWDDLTPEHKKEIEESLAESENPDTLISHEEVMKKSKEWLHGNRII